MHAIIAAIIVGIEIENIPRRRRWDEHRIRQHEVPRSVALSAAGIGNLHDKVVAGLFIGGLVKIDVARKARAQCRMMLMFFVRYRGVLDPRGRMSDCIGSMTPVRGRGAVVIGDGIETGSRLRRLVMFREPKTATIGRSLFVAWDAGILNLKIN